MYCAESDCTAAIQLDDSYIKSYYRRATVRMTLKHYTKAEEDAQKILSLDPSNKEAKFLLDQINKKLSNTKVSLKWFMKLPYISLICINVLAIYS